MNLVLVGYRGTGKSSVANALGSLLHREVVSLDAQIIGAAGRSVPEIVAELGWDGFRDLEEKICRQYAEQDGRVIDCGGGVIERPANRQVLQEHGHVFWLKASVATIVSRIGGDSQRPSLTGSQSFTAEVAEVLARRTPLYQQLAPTEIETDQRTVAEIASEIAARFTASL